jgi:tRNA synthetases class I (M)
VIGKDIVRFHAVYWPAFLMSAGIEVPLPSQQSDWGRHRTSGFAARIAGHPGEFTEGPLEGTEADWPSAISGGSSLSSSRPTLGSRKRNGAGSFSHQPH